MKLKINKKYNWKQTAAKAGIVFLEVLLAYLLSLIVDVEYLIFLAPLFESIFDLTKHFWK